MGEPSTVQYLPLTGRCTGAMVLSTVCTYYLCSEAHTGYGPVCGVGVRTAT